MTLALWSVFFPSGPDEQTGIRNHHLETRVNIPRLAAAGARSCPSTSVCRKLGAWVRRSWELRFLFPEEPTLCFSCRSFHWLPLLSANCWQLPSEHVENSEPFLLMNPLSRRPTHFWASNFRKSLQSGSASPSGPRSLSTELQLWGITVTKVTKLSQEGKYEQVSPAPTLLLSFLVYGVRNPVDISL